MKLRHIHIVGIVGAGTSAIATWAKGAGIKVTGSDVPTAHGPAKRQLELAGIAWRPGFSAHNITGRPDLVVVTNDHGGPEGNPEALAAKARGLDVVTYGDVMLTR
jgi:UDP-N-acetylmuramate--alanine ligase